VKAVEIEIEPGKARPLKGNALIEPSALQPTVVYENVMTGESFQFQIDELPLGMASAVAGKFYFSYHPLRYYYCDSVAEGIVKWHMVESFQNGELIRVTYTQKVQYSVYYIPVTDKRTIRRLEKRLKDYLALPRRHAPLS
jgi:hypothetical protein